MTHLGFAIALPSILLWLIVSISSSCGGVHDPWYAGHTLPAVVFCLRQYPTAPPPSVYLSSFWLHFFFFIYRAVVGSHGNIPRSLHLCTGLGWFGVHSGGRKLGFPTQGPTEHGRHPLQPQLPAYIPSVPSGRSHNPSQLSPSCICRGYYISSCTRLPLLFTRLTLHYGHSLPWGLSLSLVCSPRNTPNQPGVWRP